jgi:ferredoxin
MANPESAIGGDQNTPLGVSVNTEKCDGCRNRESALCADDLPEVFVEAYAVSSEGKPILRMGATHDGEPQFVKDVKWGSVRYKIPGGVVDLRLVNGSDQRVVKQLAQLVEECPTGAITLRPVQIPDEVIVCDSDDRGMTVPRVNGHGRAPFGGYVILS